MKQGRMKKKEEEEEEEKGETLITNRSVKSRRAKANSLICIIDTSCSILARRRRTLIKIWYPTKIGEIGSGDCKVKGKEVDVLPMLHVEPTNPVPVQSQTES